MSGGGPPDSIRSDLTYSKRSRQKLVQTINIVTMVDVIGALSNGTLRQNIFMADNGPCSHDNGTDALITACNPGQCVTWMIHPIDVQSPVLITAITFLNIAKEEDTKALSRAFDHPPGLGGDPHWFCWSGIVPCYLKPGLYRYSLKLQMGKGIASTMSTDMPALQVMKPWSPWGAAS